MEYATIALYLRVNNHEEFIVTAHGPDGEWAQSRIPYPFNNEELKELDGFVKNGVAEPEDFSLIGRMLGNILFPNRVKQLFHSIQQKILAVPEHGLQVRLHFPADEQQTFVSYWPWEIVIVDDLMLIMNPRIAIVRTFDSFQPFSAPAVYKEFDRLLLVGASPENLPEVNFQEEFDGIQMALEGRIQNEKLKIDPPLLNPSLSELEDRLRSNTYEILHFAGLARVNNGEAEIFLTDHHGKSQLISSQQLNSVLMGTGIRMVVLNAGGPDGLGQAIGRSLTSIGVPIVISHNYPIFSNKVTLAFSTKFYSVLAETNSLNQAMFMARRSLAQINGAYWMAPVMHSRMFEGQFWSSESDYFVETVIENGRLVTRTRNRNEYNTETFDANLQNVIDNRRNVKNRTALGKIDNLILQAKRAVETNNVKNATEAITAANQVIINAIDKREQDQRREASLFTILAFCIVAFLAALFNENWAPGQELPVIGLPISVIVWSFLGGIAAMQQAFIGTRKGAGQTYVHPEWLRWRPIIGTLMGSVIYIAFNAGLIALNQEGLNQPNTHYFVWALAFIGGFSDRFTILIFDRFVRTMSDSEEDKNDDKQQSESGSSSEQTS